MSATLPPELLAHLEAQRRLQRVVALEESEMAARLALARAQHDELVSTAQRFISALHKMAALIEPLVTATFVRMLDRLHVSPRGEALAGLSPTTMSARSPQQPSRRLVASPRNAGGDPIITEVAVDASVHDHRLDVATRRLDNDTQHLSAAVERLRDNEQRRAEAYLRRSEILAARASSAALTRGNANDPVSIEAANAAVVHHKRAMIREKHVVLTQQSEMEALRKTAHADAVRFLDAARADELRKAAVQASLKQADLLREGFDAVRNTSTFRQSADAATELLRSRRELNSASFRLQLERSAGARRQALNQADHLAEMHNAKRLRSSVYAAVTLPETSRTTASRNSSGPSISDTSYARLCGPVHSILTGSLNALRSEGDTDAWAALVAPRSYVVRGPTQVLWR